MESSRAKSSKKGEGGARSGDQGVHVIVAFPVCKIVLKLSQVRDAYSRYASCLHEYVASHVLSSQEREDTLRRRNMTDDERRMEDMMLGKHLGKDKTTIKFMQKYYHKGAFYMVRGGIPFQC